MKIPQKIRLPFIELGLIFLSTAS